MEILKKWVPLSGLSSKYSLEGIFDGVENLTITLSDLGSKNKSILVHFEESVRAYKNTRKKFWPGVKYFDKKSYDNWAFFKIENSNFITWISDKSYDLFPGKLFIHLVFVLSDSVIEVIASVEPKVEMEI